MTTYQWLCLLGVPSLVTVLGVLWRRIAAMQKGMQALLRAQMINDYNRWEEKGYAPIYARQNFENCWQQYHTLGANGVMDDLHAKFLALPTEKPTTKGE